MLTEDGTAFDLTGPDDAPVVALIHGLGLNRRVWQWMLPALEARFRVLNYDLIGHGESALPPGDLDLRRFSEQLRGLMDETRIERCAVAGFSLGGMINRRFAMDHPDRASGVVILNSPHERTPEAQKFAEENAAKVQEGGPGATLDAAIVRWFTPAYIDSHPDEIAMVREWVLANDHDAYVKARRVLAHGVIELIRPDPPITHPALVMTCENDSGSTPGMSRAIASEIPDAETIIVPGLQHMGLAERPGAFTEPMLRFLDGLRP